MTKTDQDCTMFMQLNILILQLIERVIDEEASLEEVAQLMNFFEHDTEYYDYFIGYKLLRDAYPKKKIDVVPLALVCFDSTGRNRNVCTTVCA